MAFLLRPEIGRWHLNTSDTVSLTYRQLGFLYDLKQTTPHDDSVCVKTDNTYFFQ